MKRLVIGNWKLYVNSLAEGKKLLRRIDAGTPRGAKAEVVVCPPVPLSVALRTGCRGRRIRFGAQDASFETEGAHTGESSPRALAASGIEYVILGHSERRAAGEGNETVAKKVAAALGEKLRVVLCVSEKERDQNGAYLGELAEDITASLARVEAADAPRIVLANEPLWAIGGEEAPPPRAISETALFMRKTLAELWGRDAAFKTRILYGGAVNPENASALAREAKIDGVLVGHWSADPAAFSAIVRAFSERV